MNITAQSLAWAIKYSAELLLEFEAVRTKSLPAYGTMEISARLRVMRPHWGGGGCLPKGVEESRSYSWKRWSVYIYHCLLPWYHCNYGRRTKRNKLVCPEGSGDKVAMPGQGVPCWEMVAEWLLLRLQSRGRWREASGCISQHLQAPWLGVTSTVCSWISRKGEERGAKNWEFGWDLWTAHFASLLPHLHRRTEIYIPWVFPGQTEPWLGIPDLEKTLGLWFDIRKIKGYQEGETLAHLSQNS